MIRPSAQLRGGAAGRCCLRPAAVEDGHESVCTSCGTVLEERRPDAGPDRPERAESGVQAARVRAGCEAAVGTRDVSPRSIMRSKKYRRILEGARDPFEAALRRACGMLSLPPACCGRAAHLARAARARCGRTAPVRRACVAYFAIYKACAEYGIRSTEDDMAGAVRAAFSVKRRFRPRRAVFAVESILVESGGLEGVLGADAAGPAGPAGPAGAGAACLRRIASEPLRRSALRLSDQGTPLEAAVEMAMRFELIGGGGGVLHAAPAGRAPPAAAAAATPAASATATAAAAVPA